MKLRRMTPRKKTSFEELQALWYKKLKKSGFDDIEQAGGTANRTTTRSINFLDPELRDTIESYYRMCHHFLNEYKFTTALEKAIWQYHSDGLSIRDVADTLRKLRRKKISKTKVGAIVKDLETIMKSRYLST